MQNSIIARLGLDASNFNGGIASVMSRVKSMGSGIASIGGKLSSSLLGGIIGGGIVNSIVNVTKTIMDGVSASKELGITLDNALQPTNARYASLDRLVEKLEETSAAIAEGDKALNSTWGRSMGDVRSIGATLWEGIKDPGGAITGTSKRVDYNAENEAKVNAAKAQREALKNEIGQKANQELANKTAGLRISQEEEARRRADQKRDEQLGAATKRRYAPDSLMMATIRQEHALEIEEIKKKLDLEQDERNLQQEITELKGTAYEKSVKALEIEIKHLTALRNRKDINDNERRKYDASIQQKQTVLTKTQTSEAARKLDQTPQEREAERQAIAKQKRLERTAEAQAKDKADRYQRNHRDPIEELRKADAEAKERKANKDAPKESKKAAPVAPSRKDMPPTNPTREDKTESFKDSLDSSSVLKAIETNTAQKGNL